MPEAPTFREQYEALEKKFCERVQADFDEFGLSSSLLRNIRPEGPADYVLIAMEPSLGGGKRSEGDARPPEWEEAQKRTNRNFSHSIEDFILHFCIRKYLCGEGETYHLTDLSKGAMSVSDAASKSKERYERWYSLLKEELQLVAESRETRVIAIGSEVAEFLSHKDLCDSTEKILHYSRRAGGSRESAIKPWKPRFPEFCDTVSLSDIEETAKSVCKQAGYSENTISRIMRRLQKGAGLTEPRKKLMFLYKKRFEELRSSPDIVLRDLS